MASLTSIYVKPRRRIPAWLWPAAGDPGVEHLSLVRAGLGILALDFLMIFLPQFAYAGARFVLHPLALLWLGIAIPRMTRRLKFSLPFILLMLLQVWMVVSMLVAEQYISKPLNSGEYLWFPVENGVIYLLVLGLGTLMPGSIRYVINIFLSFCAITAFVAILQALHFGPFIRLADFYVYRSIENWDNVSGIRASGLTTDPNTNILILLIGASFIAYKSGKRPLTRADWILWAMFIVASFVGQHRSSMPLVALTFLVTLGVMLRRRPKTFITVLGVAAGGLLLAMTIGRHTFAYTFETEWSSNSPELAGRLREEAAADRLYDKFPITGIGPTPTTETFGVARTDYDFKVENLYHAILMVLGAPGLIIVLAIYLAALAQCVGFLFNPRIEYARKLMAVAGALGAISLLWNGNVRVNITTFNLMFCYMTLLAVVQVTLTDDKQPGKRRNRISPYLQSRDDSTALARL